MIDRNDQIPLRDRKYLYFYLCISCFKLTNMPLPTLNFVCRFAMHELGLSSRKPFKKCARVVGEVTFLLIFSVGNISFYLLKKYWTILLLVIRCNSYCNAFLKVLGKFHPHGDTAVYDSLVRMAQVLKWIMIVSYLL